MWSTTSFAELAKKAQEAATSTNFVNIPFSSSQGIAFFHLDSMLPKQDENESDGPKKKDETKKDESSLFPTSWSQSVSWTTGEESSKGDHKKECTEPQVQVQANQEPKHPFHPYDLQTVKDEEEEELQSHTKVMLEESQQVQEESQDMKCTVGPESERPHVVDLEQHAEPTRIPTVQEEDPVENSQKEDQHKFSQVTDSLMDTKMECTTSQINPILPPISTILDTNHPESSSTQGKEGVRDEEEELPIDRNDNLFPIPSEEIQPKDYKDHIRTSSMTMEVPSRFQDDSRIKNISSSNLDTSIIFVSTDSNSLHQKICMNKENENPIDIGSNILPSMENIPSIRLPDSTPTTTGHVDSFYDVMQGASTDRVSHVMASFDTSDPHVENIHVKTEDMEASVSDSRYPLSSHGQEVMTAMIDVEPITNHHNTATTITAATTATTENANSNSNNSNSGSDKVNNLNQNNNVSNTHPLTAPTAISNFDYHHHEIAFMEQLERLHTQHQIDLREMETSYQQQIQELQVELSKKAIHNTMVATSNGTSSSGIALHDKCLAQQRKLEKEFNRQLEAKEKEIMELQRQCEDISKQYQLLQEEVIPLRNIQADSAEVKKQMDALTHENESLKVAMAASTAELARQKESFGSLKSRVKSVAMELKERREECKALNEESKELHSVIERLEQEKKVSESQSILQKLTIDERDDTILCLQGQLTHVNEQMERVKTDSHDTLVGYKKKAQESVAEANARLVVANQSRERAEIDANNARIQYEQVISLVAKLKEECDATVTAAYAGEHELNHKLAAANDDLLVKETIIEQLKNDYSLVTDQLAKVTLEKEKVIMESKDLTFLLSLEKEKANSLSHELMIASSRNEELQDKLLKRTTNSFSCSSDPVQKEDYASKSISNELAESLLTVERLEHELEEAKVLLEDMRETLRKTAQSNVQDLSSCEPKHDNISYYSPPESKPFLFVLEKQVELDTAREELSRLASLLGDAESTSASAREAMEEMKKRMEEAEARLKRYEKLALPLDSSASSVNSFGNSLYPVEIRNETANVDSLDQMPTIRSTVNIEYLKNIVLSYINANSLKEKKILLPVLSAVLELTSDEQYHAMKNIEHSADIQTVGVSLIENVQSKGIVHSLFGW